ncbi:MAG: HypC/HybG/HupF family hydrogenase formation chaperone [Gemmatimonadota bacterium]|nr:HypC/HybG/HupF family hydrogenase formation chaperone [Gemmatimonadota bacterium]
MCLAVPGQIVEFLDSTHHLAKAEVSGVRRAINVGLLVPDGLAIGDWVLIHVGFALSKIDAEEARRTIEFLVTLGSDYAEELKLIEESQIE